MKSSLYIPSGLIVYLVVTGLRNTTAQTKARRQADALLFGPTDVVRRLLIVMILGFACGSIYVSLTPPQSLLGAIVFGSIAMAGTFAFPANIIVNSTEVVQARWWGAQRAISWKEVNRIEYHKGPATTVVIAMDGRRIVHSGWNRDTEGFLAWCEEKTGIAVTMAEM